MFWSFALGMELPGAVMHNSQLFSYLIVIDFEATCWQDKANAYSSEIIEFPAVLMNMKTGEIEDQFHYYVQPTEHHRLSDFCKNLTGINQAQVNDGIPIGTCLKLFNDWIDKLRLTKKIHLPTSAENLSMNNQAIVVTWTNWDLNVCLQYECKRKRLKWADYLQSWIDLKATYKMSFLNFYGRAPQGLNGALEDLCIKFEGRQHSGIDDACNTARLAWRMVCDGCVMKATKSLLMPISDINRRFPSRSNVNAGGTICIVKFNSDSTLTDRNVDTPLISDPSCPAALESAPKKKRDSSEFKTPGPLQRPVATVNSSTITPPLCECGRRCKRKQVVNPGPNIGRVFYSCALVSPANKSSGCKYFKWEIRKSSGTQCIVGSNFQYREQLKESCKNLFRT